jgi:hypothetical protein
MTTKRIAAIQLLNSYFRSTGEQTDNDIRYAHMEKLVDLIVETAVQQALERGRLSTITEDELGSGYKPPQFTLPDVEAAVRVIEELGEVIKSLPRETPEKAALVKQFSHAVAMQLNPPLQVVSTKLDQEVITLRDDATQLRADKLRLEGEAARSGKRCEELAAELAAELADLADLKRPLTDPDFEVKT